MGRLGRARAEFVDPGYTIPGYTYTDDEGQEHTVDPVTVRDSNVTADVNLGWWVAGDITSDVALAALDATATYQGHAIGSVANNLNDSGWKTYVATGDMKITWSFADRLGDLSISHFDNERDPWRLSLLRTNVRTWWHLRPEL